MLLPRYVREEGEPTGVEKLFSMLPLYPVIELPPEKLAEVKGTSVEEVARVTTANARRLFGLEARTSEGGAGGG